MQLKLQTLALILALLIPQLHFSYGGTEGEGALKTQELDSTEIKLSMTSYYPM